MIAVTSPGFVLFAAFLVVYFIIQAMQDPATFFTFMVLAA